MRKNIRLFKMRNPIIIVILASFFMWPGTVFSANVTLPFYSSFTGCNSDTDYPLGTSAVCGSNDTIYTSVSTLACSSTGNQVVTAANYSGGVGGRGWRRWICSSPSPSTVVTTTGSMTINLNDEPEIWVRYYTRYQAGSDWSTPFTTAFQKLVYIRPFGNGSILDLNGVDGMRMTTQSGGGIGSGVNIYLCSSGCGWNTLNPTGGASSNSGANLGDGSWHSIEFHFKNQSGTATYDGVFDVWIDDVQKTHQTGINWYSGYSPGVASLQFMINQSFPSNKTPMYNDIDDIAISNTGYIGAIRPSPPKNAR